MVCDNGTTVISICVTRGGWSIRRRLREEALIGDVCFHDIKDPVEEHTADNGVGKHPCCINLFGDVPKITQLVSNGSGSGSHVRKKKTKWKLREKTDDKEIWLLICETVEMNKTMLLIVVLLMIVALFIHVACLFSQRVSIFVFNSFVIIIFDAL